MNRKQIMGIVLIGSACLIGLHSCQIVNKYKTPEIDSSELFRTENPEDTTTIASIPWREYFKDPILQGLIFEGLSNNYDLRMAVTRVEQAEAALGMARAAYFPSVTLVGNATQSRYSVKSTGEKDVLGQHSNSFSLAAAVSWELDVWGKLNRQSRAKYAQFLMSQEYRNVIQTSLIANIATSYYSLMSLDEQLRVTEEMIGLLVESTETIQALMESGMLTAAAVEQSKALLYSTQVSVPNIKSQIQQLENSICLLLGRKPGSVNRAAIAEQTVPEELNVGLPVQMLANRPDVRQAELNFRSAFELTNAAQASFYPTISLGSNNGASMIGYSSNTLSGFFKPENLIANIVGSLAQPIFAKKQLITQLNVAKSQQQEALLGFEKAVLSAGKEVSDILFAYQSSLSKNEIRDKQVEALLKSVDYTQALLKAGEANYTEVLNAEQNLLQAQLSQVSDKLEQLQYSVNLYRALGGGIE